MSYTEHTPGPWAWFGNARSNCLYLATEKHGRRFVMDFVRWGFRAAQPRFQPGKGVMVPASELLQFEVGDRDVVGVAAAQANRSVYRLDVRGIDCADARLIAAAPELLAALDRLSQAARNACNAAQHTELANALFDADMALNKAEGRS